VPEKGVVQSVLYGQTNEIQKDGRNNNNNNNNKQKTKNNQAKKLKTYPKFITVIEWNGVGQRLPQQDRCFVGPTPRDIPYCITTPSQDKQRTIERLDIFDSSTVSFGNASGVQTTSNNK